MKQYAYPNDYHARKYIEVGTEEGPEYVSIFCRYPIPQLVEYRRRIAANAELSKQGSR